MTMRTDQEEEAQFLPPLERFITCDPAMLLIKEQVARIIAPSHYPVMILGETGTGKELIAEACHGLRAAGTFMAINCAAMPEALIESELFGHVKGAFTGATVDKIGLLERAGEGTVFLDEVGEMPKLLQSKLLRVLNDHKVRPVGCLTDRRIACRFIAATNVLAASENSIHGLRPDLYHRLATIELTLTPLRVRQEDIALIAKAINKAIDPVFANDLKWRKLYGNVRELQNIVIRNMLGI